MRAPHARWPSSWQCRHEITPLQEVAGNLADPGFLIFQRLRESFLAGGTHLNQRCRRVQPDPPLPVAQRLAQAGNRFWTAEETETFGRLAADRPTGILQPSVEGVDESRIADGRRRLHALDPDLGVQVTRKAQPEIGCVSLGR